MNALKALYLYRERIWRQLSPDEQQLVEQLIPNSDAADAVERDIIAALPPLPESPEGVAELGGDFFQIAAALKANESWPVVVYYRVPSELRWCLIQPAGEGLYHYRFSRADFGPAQGLDIASGLESAILDSEYWGNW